MTGCDKCERPAKFLATRRLGVFRAKPQYLCERHAKIFERTEDVILTVGLVLAVAFFVVSFLRDHRLGQDQARAAEQKRIADLDLDGDGVVSVFEEQATEEQRRNFRLTGYPFVQVFQPGQQPDMTIRHRIEPAHLTAAVDNPSSPKPLATYFPHPRLMRRFVDQHTAPNCQSCLSAVYLTEDDYLAFLLKSPSTGQINMICLERIAPELATMMLNIPGPPEPKEKRRIRR
jgi:hypothetical protein